MQRRQAPDAMQFPDGLEPKEKRLQPFEWYKRHRQDNPVKYDEDRDCWDVFRYDDVERVLSNHEEFSSEAHPDRMNTMSNSDPPLHTRLRDPVEEFFRPGEIDRLEPEIRETTRELIDQAVDGRSQGEFDAVADLAYHLPILTISELLGVPKEDRHQFKQWSNTVVAAPDDYGGSWEKLERERNKALKELASYYRTLFEQKRENPQDDLITKILALEDEASLTDEQILNLCNLLLIAGNVSTTQLLSWSVYCLANRPELMETIQGDERKIKMTVEEVLRYRSSVQRLLRVTKEDVQLDNTTIEAGSHVVAWVGSANRDSRRFDRPDTFVYDRSPNQHLTFGKGIHMCLGSSLARLEAKVMIEELFETFESLEPIEMAHEPISSSFLYGMKENPIRFETADTGRQKP